MDTKQSLNHIRPRAIQQLSSKFATDEDVRIGFESNLNQFFDLLLRALESGESAWMEMILSEWVQTRTETELRSLENKLTPLLGQILITLADIANQELNPGESNCLLRKLLPLFTYSVEYSAREETRLYVKHITDELDQAKTILERLEKSKSDFISVAAHELKTPLTLIEGYTAMLNDTVTAVRQEQSSAQVYLKGINAGTKRLREIVDDMIDVSLIDNDLLSITFQPLWLNQILRAISRELVATIQERNLKFSIREFDGLKEMIYGDGERLYQAFRNVIINAVKYTPDNGTITVDGRMLPGFIETTITDNGIGIDPEDHVLIFEKFGRLGSVSLHSSSKTKFKGGGPGLGLSITKGIIEAHGGAIWVESEAYDEIRCPGSSFHIMLPLRKTPPDDKTAKLFRDLK